MTGTSRERIRMTGDTIQSANCIEMRCGMGQNCQGLPQSSGTTIDPHHSPKIIVEIYSNLPLDCTGVVSIIELDSSISSTE